MDIQRDKLDRLLLQVKIENRDGGFLVCVDGKPAAFFATWRQAYRYRIQRVMNSLE
jgi:hypothetical protein